MGSPYQYDAAGNLLSDGNHTYTYDAENRITQVDGGATATYIYNGLGQRVAKISPGSDEEYLYDASGQINTVFHNDFFERMYVYLNGKQLAEYFNNTTYFPMTDQLGSTRLLTAMDQSVQESDDYYPYGEPTTAGTDSILKFTAKERDSETELDNFDFRYYSSSLGRFLKPDDSDADLSLNNPQGLNLYEYVRNNPLRYTDPTGHTCQTNPDDGSIYDDGDGKGCDTVDEQDKNSPPSAVVDGCQGDGAADCLAFFIADDTTVQNLSEVGKNGVEGAMASEGFAEGLWNIFAGTRGILSGATTAGEMLKGVVGIPVSRAELEEAANSGGETVNVVTSLTKAPSAGRGLSVSLGDNAEALAKAAQPNGQMYSGQIPKQLITLLEKAGLARESLTDMGRATAHEIRFDPKATEFIVKFLK